MPDPIADRLAVGDVIIRYATSVDTRDMDRYASCFAEDAVVSGFGEQAYEGRDAWMGYVTVALQRFGRTQHLIGNQVVEIDGDAAHLRSYVQATHELVADQETLVVLWACYDTHLARTAEGWKIKRHHLERQIGPRRVPAI